MLNEYTVKLNRLSKIKSICNVCFWILVLISLISIMILIFTKGENLFIEHLTIVIIGLMVVDEIISLFLRDKIMQYNELAYKESNRDNYSS